MLLLLTAIGLPLDLPAQEILPSPAPPRVRTLEQRSISTPEERAAEIARLRYHLYRRVEYPLRLSQLDAEIELAEAEAASLDKQIAEYERLSRPRGSQPFLVTLESARLRRLAAEWRAKNLRKEKLLLIENFQIERRLRRLEMEAE
jgi:hypothetical protein